MAGYERHSETERVLVHDDSLANLNELKIQSNLVGNYEDNGLTKPYNADRFI
jgi:hypothetical protein